MEKRRRTIKIDDAGNACIILPGTQQSRGYVYNLSKWGGSCQFQLLKFPSMEDKYMELQKGTLVKVLSKAEIEKVTTKYGDHMVGKIPHAGCSLGTDPEVFVVDEKNVIIPAFKFLKDKSESVPFSFRNGLGIPFWDGFQAEFTTDVERSSNSSCLSFTIDDVRNGLREVLKAARKVNPKAKLTWQSVLDIPSYIMDEADPPHKELGCAPSKNVYPHIKPLKIDDPSMLPFRFAGCHLHLGFGPREEEVVEQIVKSIDAIWGTVSICLLRGMEDKRRRAFYGRAGEYRDPKHGIEYRTTSSAVLAHPVLLHLAFDISRAASYIGLNGLNKLWRANEDDIISAINFYDVSKAEAIVRANEPILKSILNNRYSMTMAKKVLKMIYKGALTYFDGLKDMVEVWRLDRNWSSHASSGGCSVYNAKGSGNEDKLGRGYNIGDTDGM